MVSEIQGYRLPTTTKKFTNTPVWGSTPWLPDYIVLCLLEVQHRSDHFHSSKQVYKLKILIKLLPDLFSVVDTRNTSKIK